MAIADKEYLEYLIKRDEYRYLEFKATLRITDQGKENRDLTKKIIKSLLAFANTNGGRILVGYHERNKEFVGIERDKFIDQSTQLLDEEGWTKHFQDLMNVHNSQKGAIDQLVNIEFVEYAAQITCAIISIARSEELIAYLDGVDSQEEFWVRQPKQLHRLNNDQQKKDHLKNRNINLPRGWSINVSTGYLNKKILKENWKGGWAVTPDNLKRLPDSRGLYIFYTSVPKAENNLFGNFGTVLYVGSSRNSVKSRASSHWRGSNQEKFRSAEKLYKAKFKISYLELEDESLGVIKSYEGQIIDYFSPPLNNKRESATEPRQIEGVFE